MKQQGIDFDPLHPSSTSAKVEQSPSVNESVDFQDGADSTEVVEHTPSTPV